MQKCPCNANCVQHSFLQPFALNHIELICKKYNSNVGDKDIQIVQHQARYGKNARQRSEMIRFGYIIGDPEQGSLRYSCGYMDT